MAHRFTQIAAGLLFLLIPGKLCAQFAGPNVPMVASGQMPTAVPGDGASRSNLFSASFAVAARFDDNAIVPATKKRSDIAYSFRPNFSVVQTFRRFDYGLSYSPGIDISEHGFYGDQFTNIFGGHFTWLLSKHSSFSMVQSYILSTDPFQQFGSQPFTTAPGPVVAPNQSVFLPNVRRTTSFSQAHIGEKRSEEHTSELQ